MRKSRIKEKYLAQGHSQEAVKIGSELKSGWKSICFLMRLRVTSVSLCGIFEDHASQSVAQGTRQPLYEEYLSECCREYLPLGCKLKACWGRY